MTVPALTWGMQGNEPRPLTCGIGAGLRWRPFFPFATTTPLLLNVMAVAQEASKFLLSVSHWCSLFRRWAPRGPLHAAVERRRLSGLRQTESAGSVVGNTINRRHTRRRAPSANLLEQTRLNGGLPRPRVLVGRCNGRTPRTPTCRLPHSQAIWVQFSFRTRLRHGLVVNLRK